MRPGNVGTYRVAACGGTVPCGVFRASGVLLLARDLSDGTEVHERPNTVAALPQFCFEGTGGHRPQ